MKKFIALLLAALMVLSLVKQDEEESYMMEPLYSLMI